MYTKDQYTSQDIVQEVFLKLWDRRDSIRITHAKAYLFHMGRNVILNKFRNTKERFYFLERLPEIADYDVENDVEYVTSDILIEIVHEAINKLPPKMSWNIHHEPTSENDLQADRSRERYFQKDRRKPNRNSVEKN